MNMSWEWAIFVFIYFHTLALYESLHNEYQNGVGRRYQYICIYCLSKFYFANFTVCDIERRTLNIIICTDSDLSICSFCFDTIACLVCLFFVKYIYYKQKYSNLNLYHPCIFWGYSYMYEDLFNIF